MVNRRHIRIKVMQTVYGIFQSKNDDLTKEEKYLLYSVQKAIDLYVLQLRLFVDVKNLAFEHLEIKKKNFLATAEEKNPNSKFINNELIRAIENSDEINSYLNKKKLDNWKEDKEYVRVIWDLIQKSEAYKNYISINNSSLKEDKEFVSVVFKEIIAPNEKLIDYYESINLGWVDDLPIVNTSILKSIKQFKTGKIFSLKGLDVKEDDQEFLIDLFRKTILHHHEFTDEIDAKTPNWDTDRIAEIDLILIKMALTEFLYFPSIPTKVTINEYIEIAKDYSTAKSSYFINGVLDKLLKDFNKTERLQKIGRGLL
ncbi:MAG: transcription antitermination factor NusB [Flavobacteriaceae bacterium]|nr:transcription antitermination factor NusB [Flavobacteriaceae bacterium]